ncbi:hypothetical protein GCM10011389_06420 [Pontibacillus salipaludis]|uniref:Uncharacterized protein n=1 Tax=Pontibacillus salipaludis TaxID=1697394 RepID=A0ABQ1PRD6_9BACI|nr:hypothetical protein GCM10011389_06420 [Pontibacillus salipaludis]
MPEERLDRLGDNSLSCGELGSLLNRYALSGVSPRLLSRGSLAVPKPALTLMR